MADDWSPEDQDRLHHDLIRMILHVGRRALLAKQAGKPLDAGIVEALEQPMKKRSAEFLQAELHILLERLEAGILEVNKHFEHSIARPLRLVRKDGTNG